MIGECLVNARDVRLRGKPATASDAESDKLSAMSSTSSTSDDVRALNCFTSVVFYFTFMVALCIRADHYIFILFLSFFLSFFLSSSFFSSPNLSGRRLDVYHTLAHGVALVQI